jgi:hypothetical protein
LCNTAKAARTIEEFLAHDPKLCASIKAQLKAPLKDASAVNATRWALYEALADTGLPVSLVGRAHQVQPHTPRHPEDARTRCCLCR